MLKMGICDACLMGLTSSLEGTSIWGNPGNWSKKKQDTSRGKETLKLIMIDVKQGFVWGYSGSKILGGCTWEERIGYRNLERIQVFPCFLGRKIRDSESKNGYTWLCATRCMQPVGWGIKGTCRGDMHLLCWKATPKQQWACHSDKL